MISPGSPEPALQESTELNIQAFRRNDEETLQRIYAENYRAAERYVLQNSGTSDHARDIYQEAFIAAWRNIRMGRFEPREGHSLQAYLLRIVRHKWIDHLRSSRHRNTVRLREDQEPEWEGDSLPDETQQQLEQVKKGFRSLGDSCREVLRRFYFRKESLRTIAEAFGWTEATARNNKYRCIERLRAALRNQIIH